ncbi:MAG: fimbria/pilus outer membrane usher protein, partial [Pseudomonadota bacterium]
AFGRVQQLNYSFYFSDQPLREGLQEYSYNLGALRRDYGVESNHYGPVALSLFHRYGLSEAITLGWRADGMRDFYNTGPLATFVLGSAGVLNLALAASSFNNQRGTAGMASYSYQANNWSLGASLRRDRGNFATLGDPPTITNRNYEGSVVASYYSQRYGSISLGHSALLTRSVSSTSLAQPSGSSLLENRRVTTLSYGVPLISGRVSLQASLSHTKDSTSRNEAFMGLIFFLDKDYSLGASYTGNREDQTSSLQLTKNQPVGEGLGYRLSTDRASVGNSLNSRLDSQLQYNAPAAILRGEFGQRRDKGQTSTDYSVSVAGGLAYVDGQFAWGRPVTESFGIVKVGDLAGVAVMVNGQPIGKTDAQGKIFIPTLAPYFDNDISITPESVPIEYLIPSTVKSVSPSFRSGTVIDFGVVKIQAFTGKLKSRKDNITKAVEFQEIKFSTEGKLQTFPTGRGGEFYIENIKPGSYAATILVEGKPCIFDLLIPSSGETFVDLGELVCQLRP